MAKKPKKKRIYRQQPKIRWTKSQIQRLKETVDAYNKNVRRVKRRKDVGAYAPPTEKFSELRKQISSANELNRIVRQLGKFAKIKGKPDMYTNPHGVTMTQWSREKMRSDTLAENRRRMENIERLESGALYDFSGNLIPNAKREQLKSQHRLIEAKPETIKSVETFVSLEKNLRRMAYLANPKVQLKRLKENMKKAIANVLGKQSIKYYENFIEQMEVENFEEYYLENEDLMEDFFNYQSESVAEIIEVKEDGEPLTYEDIFKNRLKQMIQRYRHVSTKPKKQTKKKSKKRKKKK